MDEAHPVLDVAAMRTIFHDLPGKPSSRATWWSVVCAVDSAQPVTAEGVADLLDMPADQVARALSFLGAQGLVDVDAGGVASRAQAHLSDFSSSTSLALVGSKSQELETTRTCALAWVAPAIVRKAGHLDEAAALCIEFAAQVEERGDRRASNRALTRAWVLPMEAMIRLDGHEPVAIRRVMLWLHAGRDEPSAFWRNNVLSPTTLRTRWDRMATQYAAAKRGKPSKSSAVLQHPGAPRLADRLGANRG